MPIPIFYVPYDTMVFSENFDKVISLIYIILGYDRDNLVNKTILGFLYSLTPSSGAMTTSYDFCRYLAEAIHSQFDNIHGI